MEENKERKVMEAIEAIISGRFYERDYNDQESGSVLYESLLADSKVGEKYTVSADPNSCRECAAGEYLLTVVGKNPGTENWHNDYVVSIKDKMGNIGSYPNFEHYQNHNCSGTYIVRLWADGQFQINPEEGFDPEKVRALCISALRDVAPATLLNVAGQLKVRIME